MWGASADAAVGSVVVVDVAPGVEELLEFESGGWLGLGG